VAKMNKKTQQQTAKASNNFEPFEGVMHVRLRGVDATRTGPSGPYWSWEFEVVEGEHEGRRLWNNTSLSEAAAFKMKETYDAFGAEYDADTDDLCGQVCRADVEIVTQQQGRNKGQLTSQIRRLSPKDPDFEAGEPVGAGAGAGPRKPEDDIL
jgi:hypothetical protein